MSERTILTNVAALSIAREPFAEWNPRLQANTRAFQSKSLRDSNDAVQNWKIIYVYQIPQAGLEPATVGLEVRRSIQLSYWG